MTAAGRKAAAYWIGWAIKAHSGFHQALETLAAASPEIAAITMNDIGSSAAWFIVRPDVTEGIYPAAVEAPVDACYRLALGFQSAVTLLGLAAAQHLPELERNLAAAQRAGLLARSADWFFRREIVQVGKRHPNVRPP
jgi:hypothetical protein